MATVCLEALYQRKILAALPLHRLSVLLTLVLSVSLITLILHFHIVNRKEFSRFQGCVPVTQNMVYFFSDYSILYILYI